MENLEDIKTTQKDDINKEKVIDFLQTAYNSNMIDIKTYNESKTNNILDFSIDYSYGYTKTASEEENINEKQEYELYKEELENLLFTSDTEWGMYSEFDEFTIEHVEDEHFMKAINEIYIKNYHNENVLIKIINAISEVEYNKVFPFGQMVAIAAVSNKSLLVQQKGIEAFERWHQESSISILENLDTKEKWLKKYVNKIIEDLKEKVKYA